MDSILLDKHIIVTGASSGIGKECAETFHDLGAKVSVVARRKELLAELCQQYNNMKSYPYDLSDVEGIEELIQCIIGERGKCDGLMFCAGFSEHVPIKMSKPEYIRRVMTINFFSFSETIRVLSNSKYFNKGASYVGMSSVSGLHGDKGLFAYSASKGAMNSAIRCAAAELAEKGIRVNGIATGYIEGTELYSSIGDRLGHSEVERFANSNQLLGIGKPKDIAYAATYLLSDFSKYVTGSIMLVDGGYMA